MFKFYIFLNSSLKRKLFLVSFLLWHESSLAFIAAILEAKKEIEGYTFALKYITDTVEELGGFKDVKKEYAAYEKELREFQKTLNEYEKLGIDVRDFVELRNYDPNSLKGQIDFFRKYIKRTHKVLKKHSVCYRKP